MSFNPWSYVFTSPLLRVSAMLGICSMFYILNFNFFLSSFSSCCCDKHDDPNHLCGGKSLLAYRLESTIEGSQSRNPSRGTVLSGSLAYFSVQPRTLPIHVWGSTTHRGLCLATSVINQENSPQANLM